MQLLNERTDVNGRHFCLGCDENVDETWNEGHGHGIVNAESRSYTALCSKTNIIASGFSLIDREHVNNSNFSDFTTTNSNSSIKTCKYIHPGSTSTIIPPSSNSTSSDILQFQSPFHLSPNNQRLLCPVNRDETASSKLKAFVSTSNEDMSTCNASAKFSKGRELDERAIQGEVGNVRHQNESTEKGSNDTSPFVHKYICPKTGVSEHFQTLPLQGKGPTRERDISDNRGINQNDTSSSSMVDHTNIMIQHRASHQCSLLPETWPTGNENSTNRIGTKKQLGPFRIDIEGQERDKLRKSWP